MVDAETRARWEFVREAVCREARRGLAAWEEPGSPKPIRISSAGESPWRPVRWKRAFMELFFLGAGSAPQGAQQDDLLFFVQLDDGAAASGTAPPLSVRRRGTTPPPELQEGATESGGVDWRSSVLLNLVLQTSYLLSVATCPRDALPEVGQQRAVPGGVLQVVTPVYASPMRVAVNLDSSRAQDAMPAPAYPDICFALDGFDETQHSMALDDLEQCYAVVLSAVDGIALPSSALRADSAAGADSAAQQPPGPQPSAAPATAPPAAAAPDPFGHIHHQQQQQQGPPPPRLDAERAPVSAAREAVAQQGEGGGGGPAEGVTVWQYVSEGGESAVPIDSRASAEPGSDAMLALPSPEAALERAFSDPLISPSHRPAPGSPTSPQAGVAHQLTRQQSAAADPAAQGDLPGITIFAGYVSCGQLRGVVGSAHSRASAAWAGRSGAAPHRVVMRGPGGQGFADVAVSVARQQEVDATSAAEADMGHPTLDSPKSGSGSSGSGERKGRLFARVAAAAGGAALQVAKGVAREVLGTGSEAEQRPLRCRLMSLSTPIELLLREVLDAWPP